MSLLRRLRDTLLRVEVVLLLVVLAAMILLSAAQVLLRQLHGGIVWIDVVVRHLVLTTAMLGAALAAGRGGHISIDLIGRLVKGRFATYMQSASSLVAAWVCVRLTLAAGTFVQMSREFGDTIEAINQPAWLWQIVIPLGFGLCALHFLLEVPLRLLHKDQEEQA